MELIESKVTAILTLALSTMLVGLLPACFSRHCRTRFPLLISALLCFGGGVLLATSLVHMLPEIRIQFKDGMRPYAELIYCAGFFLLYAVDEVAHWIMKAGRKVETGEEESGNSVGDANRNRTTYGAITYDPTAPLLGEFEASTDSRNIRQHYHDGSEPRVIQRCPAARQPPCPENSQVKSFGLILALVVHSLLEGLAVGLETSVPQVLLLLTAISTHKLVVGFCLGVELTSDRNYSRGKHFLSIVVFSCGSPAGIGLGIGISEIPSNYSELILPILQALAAGTLLYITVSEVLPRERARWHERPDRSSAGMLQFTAVLIGFIAMTLLTKYFSS